MMKSTSAPRYQTRRLNEMDYNFHNILKILPRTYTSKSVILPF